MRSDHANFYACFHIWQILTVLCCTDGNLMFYDLSMVGDTRGNSFISLSFLIRKPHYSSQSCSSILNGCFCRRKCASGTCNLELVCRCSCSWRTVCWDTAVLAQHRRRGLEGGQRQTEEKGQKEDREKSSMQDVLNIASLATCRPLWWALMDFSFTAIRWSLIYKKKKKRKTECNCLFSPEVCCTC